jgi:DNA-binding transcriptional ArsR family regulator
MLGRASLLATALACVLALPVPAQAGPDGPQGAEVPVEGHLTATGSVTLLGDNGFEAAVAGLVLQEGSLPAMEQAAFQHAGGYAKLVNVPTTYTQTPAGRVFPEEDPPQSTLWQGELPGFAFDGTAAQASRVRLLGEGSGLAFDLAPATRIVATPGSPLPTELDDRAFGDRASVDGHATRPDGGAASLTGLDSLALAWEGPFALLVEGGDVVLPDGRVLATGSWRNETASAVDPVMGYGRVVIDNHVLVVTGRDGSVAWPSQPEGWALAADGLQGELDGDVAWTGVAGQVLADGRPLPTDPDLLHMRGRLQLEAVFGEGSAWKVSGQAHFVAVDGGADQVAVAAAVAGLGLAALLLALLTEPGRHGLAFLVGRAGRLVHAEPLRSAPRRRVLAAIHASQPVRVRELQDATGLSRATVDYHLRVLLAYDVVQERSGTGERNRTYMLNSGSMMFATGPAEGADAPDDGDAASNLAADILAVANSHPLRRRLYELARDHGPLDFEAMRQLGGPDLAGLAQSTATHHLKALVAAGALAATSQGKRRLYAAAVRDDDIRLEQYRRLLGQLRAVDLVRRIAAGQRPPEGDRAATRLLRRLDDLGLVRRERGAYVLAPTLGSVAGRL